MHSDPVELILNRTWRPGLAITGAGSGIGRAVALACARCQANVVLIGRNVAKLDAVHGEIAAAGSPEASIAPLDLERAVARDYDALADAVLERYGRLDGLLHNAALLGTLTPIEHYDVPTWCRVLHVNVTAAFVLTQVLLSALKNSADASVVTTSAGFSSVSVTVFSSIGFNSNLFCVRNLVTNPRTRSASMPS